MPITGSPLSRKLLRPKKNAWDGSDGVQQGADIDGVLANDISGRPAGSAKSHTGRNLLCFAGCSTVIVVVVAGLLLLAILFGSAGGGDWI